MIFDKTIVMIANTDKEKLRSALAKAFDNFSAVLASFSDEEVNRLFPSSGWTPAQVTTHILLATDGVPDNTIHNTTRPYDAMLAHIRPWWEDLNQKFEAPDVLQPGNEPRTKSELLSELKRVREKDLGIIDKEDLSVTCADMELPTIGHLTRFEWLWFTEMHLKRHKYQLDKMIS